MHQNVIRMNESFNNQITMKMKKLLFKTIKFLLLSILITSTTYLSAQDEPSGVVTKNYDVEAFTGVEVGSAFEVKLKQGRISESHY
jgi:hypothetical protein